MSNGNGIKEYLQLKKGLEQKWMYHFEVNDPDFGVPTDMYGWCDRYLRREVDIYSLLDYFKKYYSKEEAHFIQTLETLLKDKEVQDGRN